MTDTEDAKKVICEYYDALLNDDFEQLASVCDDYLTLISLYGNILDNFKEPGISRKINYNQDQFKTTDIKTNVKQIQTALTKYSLDDREVGTWNCNYIVVKKDKKWVISLATSNNGQSTALQ